MKYVDLISGGEPVTMIVRLYGGGNAKIHPPMIAFKNINGPYLIRGVHDINPGLCYRSSPKG